METKVFTSQVGVCQARAPLNSLRRVDHHPLHPPTKTVSLPGRLAVTFDTHPVCPTRCWLVGQLTAGEACIQSSQTYTVVIAWQKNKPSTSPSTQWIIVCFAFLYIISVSVYKLVDAPFTLKLRTNSTPTLGES